MGRKYQALAAQPASSQMADTSLVHGEIMHIHELQALGAAAVGRSVRVLGKCVCLSARGGAGLAVQS